MIAVLIIFGVLLVAFGVFNYVLAILESKGYAINSKVHETGNWIIVFTFLCLLVFLCAMLVKNPGAILTHMHWGWVVLIGHIASAALAVIGSYFLTIGSERMGFSLIVAGVCTFGLMIAGLILSTTAEYEISSARGFNLLGNLPDKNGAYVIHITDDIDFKGRTVDGSFGDEDRTFYIYGNGHTIRNIKYEEELEESVCFIDGDGRITDLKLVDCEYYLQPNCYDEETHRGGSPYFDLLGNFKLTNIEIDAVVYKLPTNEMNALYENESTVGIIYPYYPSEEEKENDPRYGAKEYFPALLEGNNKISIVVKEGQQ